MGWRVSWYKADKQQPLIITKREDGYEEVEINGTPIYYDQGTDAWIDLKNNPDMQNEFKCLKEDPDIDYYSITKEGFKQIILYYRQKVIKYLKKSIELHKNPDLKCKSDYYFVKPLLDIVEEDLREWEQEWGSKSGTISYSNIDLKDNSNYISSSWTYKYGIFDMIYLFKTFDWENNELVIYGG